LQHGMRADQWKAILVITDLLQRDLPTYNGVAAFAVGAELPAMNVGMTIGTMGADVFENQAGVAFGAGHLLMHTAQGISGLVVVELGIGPDGRPACVGVAILAGRGEWSVRICHFGLRAA
jgi:hypothetical protein